MKRYSVILIFLWLLSGPAWAADLSVTMLLATDSGTGEAVGTISVRDTPYGLLFTPDLNGLSPGLHGFHVHENPNCGPGEKNGQMVAGLAAGGHYDPAGTGRHEGPYGEGHLGDPVGSACPHAMAFELRQRGYPRGFTVQQSGVYICLTKLFWPL